MEIVLLPEVESFSSFLTLVAKGLRLNPDQTRKLQFLTIMSMASSTNYVGYHNLKEALAITSDTELESVVIDAIYSGVVKGRLSQSERVFKVTSVLARDVHPSEKEHLLKTLKQM
jgi:COP9 signalosome complex subunit 7